MNTEQARSLISSDSYIAFQKYISDEITRSEKKAIASIHAKNIDEESANRAKFYQECLDIVANKAKGVELKRVSPV